LVVQDSFVLSVAGLPAADSQKVGKFVVRKVNLNGLSIITAHQQRFCAQIQSQGKGYILERDLVGDWISRFVQNILLRHDSDDIRYVPIFKKRQRGILVIRKSMPQGAYLEPVEVREKTIVYEGSDQGQLPNALEANRLAQERATLEASERARPGADEARANPQSAGGEEQEKLRQWERGNYIDCS
jgi:hypothetical protein